MRWKFADVTKPEEARLHKQTLEKISAWWAAFQNQRPHIEAFLEDREEWNLELWMDKTLQAINQDFMWEFGGDDSGAFQLVITPEGERHLRPLVHTVVSLAPQLPNWRFYQYRHPQPVAEAQDMIAEQTGLDASRLRVFVNPGEGNFIDLLYTTPEFSKSKQQNAVHAAFLSTEYMLGEEILDKWIGSIDAVAPDSVQAEVAGAHRFVTIDNLANDCLRIINAVRSQLPNQPVFKFKDTLDFTTFELEPENADDYPHRLDMVLATTVMPEMWKAAHLGLTFDSSRFSKCGERFCYLKMDGTNSYANSPQSRDRLAKTLDEKLKEAQLGCTIGGAGGLRYSYIDLALTDVERAIPILRYALDYERMPERSWLLFFDADWSQEWVGMFDTTQAPLLPETERQAV